MTHGLTSHTCAILPGEDPAEYRALLDQLEREQQPAGVLQRELVSHLAQIIWKLRRIPGIENAIVQRELKSMHRIQKMHRRCKGEPHFDTDESSPTLADVLASQFMSESNGLSRLEIYRLRLERAMHATLRQLRKLREEATEKEEPAPSPRTRGEGKGEGSCSPEHQSNPQKSPHPNPLPEYRARGSDAAGQNEPTDSPNGSSGQQLSDRETLAFATSDGDDPCKSRRGG